MSQEYSGRNRNWELRTSPTTARLLAEGDYAVEVSTSGLSGHFTKVKVTRLTDGKIIFPFEGSEILGPFNTAQEARDAGRVIAHRFVKGDMVNPE